MSQIRSVADLPFRRRWLRRLGRLDELAHVLQCFLVFLLLAMV